MKEQTVLWHRRAGGCSMWHLAWMPHEIWHLHCSLSFLSLIPLRQALGFSHIISLGQLWKSRACWHICKVLFKDGKAQHWVKTKRGEMMNKRKHQNTITSQGWHQNHCWVSVWIIIFTSLTRKWKKWGKNMVKIVKNVVRRKLCCCPMILSVFHPVLGPRASQQSACLF